MLEQKGIHGELPNGAGADYYHMHGNSEYKDEDYRSFFAKIRLYQQARAELRKRGVSEAELQKIPDSTLIDAMRSSNSKASLDDLSSQYK